MSDLNDTLVPASEESGKQPLMDLINEMQDAVTGMKQAFVVALDQMKVASEEDASLRRTVESNKAEAQEQAAQVLRLVLSFKSEFAWVRSALEAAQEQSATLSRAIQRMEGDRDALLSELVSCGAISQHARDRLHSLNTNIHYHCDVRPEHSSSSGAPSSSDSGVAHLLERAHAAFSIAPHPPPLYPDTMRQKGTKSPSLEGQHWPLQTQGGSGDSSQESAMVRDYVAGLSSGNGVESGGVEEGQWEEEERRREAFAIDAGNISSPDSDSSLSRAITKSLGLSTSLGRQCCLELDQTSGVPQPTLDHQQAANPGVSKTRKQSLKSTHSHSDSDTESSRLVSGLPKYLSDRTDGTNGMRAGLNDANKVDIFAGTRKLVDETTKASASSEEGDVEKRRKVLILELIDTERCYCDTLRTLRQTFAEPLSVQDILSPKDVDTLFPREVEALLQQHTSLLTMLEESVGKGPHGEQRRTLGDILRHFIEPEGLDALHLYTSYVDNFPDALQTFHKLCRCSPEFTNFLKDCLKSPDCGGLDLGGFLLTPVQRLPRLVLVLRRLLAITPQHHPDWAPLSFTITRLATFLSRLNDSMEHSFQLVAAQISTPPETEEDFGHSHNFDDVCGESTANEDCLETLNDLTSDGETGTEMNNSIIMKPTPMESVEAEICDPGVRRRLGQRVVSSEWEKSRPLGTINGVGEVSVHSRTDSPKTAVVQVSPEPEKVSDEIRQAQKLYHREDTPTKKTGCHCVRRCREMRCAKKYSKLCSVKSKEGRSSQDLTGLESRGGIPLRSTSEWAMGGHDGVEKHLRKQPSRCDKADRHAPHHRESYTSSSPSCCIHDCSSGCVGVERRRGTSLPRRGCGVEVRRRTHSTGRTAREQETSSDEDSTGPKSCFHSSAHECKIQEAASPSKGKVKRRWFKTSKSMHDFQNEVSEALEVEGKGGAGEGVRGRRRRRSSDDRDGKLSIARSVDNLSVDSSLSGSKDGVGNEGVNLGSALGEMVHGQKQVMYTARMLRCSSLEVATMGKVSDAIQVDKGSAGTGGATKEDSEGGKKVKNKKLSLRASIKNMLSFKRRYVREGNTREGLSSDTKKEGSCPLPPTIAFGYPYKIDENLHSLITQLNRMPTYIQLVIFCLKETTV
ncbi:uncharacterized protein [Hetaerina americana]|uniref:uncharacterized protein n=1 Tax=Hetaerina americana TaxID=62018 RepID=UPI003A7F5BEF